MEGGTDPRTGKSRQTQREKGTTTGKKELTLGLQNPWGETSASANLGEGNRNPDNRQIQIDAFILPPNSPNRDMKANNDAFRRAAGPTPKAHSSVAGLYTNMTRFHKTARRSGGSGRGVFRA